MSRPPEPVPQRLAQLEERLPALRNRLATLEVDLTVERARLSQFTGEAAARWEEFKVSTAAAWDAYLLADERCSDARGFAPLADPAAESEATRLLDEAHGALDIAEPAVDSAEATVADLALRWGQQEPRIMDTRAAARAVGAEEVVSYADLLLDLMGRDPLAITEDDVETLESQTEAARVRRVEAERKAGHLAVELSKARALDDLATTMDETRDCLTYARSRIAGLAEVDPVTSDEVTALNERLRQISDKVELLPPTPSVELAVELATELEGWRSDYDSLRARWDDGLTESCNAVQRRDQFRGTWKALRAKASSCGLDEDRDVAKVLTSVRQLLWTAPLDLDLAEQTLAQLAGHINERVRRVKERK